MKAICYISSFANNLTKETINNLIESVNKNNLSQRITGVLIIRNKHFFQVLEGESKKIDILFKKIKNDNRHTGVITLLDSKIEGRIFDDYNSGNFEVFQKFHDLKKLYLYFNWINEANYLPADKIVQLTTNFLKNST